MAAAILGIGLYFALDHFTGSSSPVTIDDGVPRAAIVDQLSISQPDEGFVEECTALLNNAGFVVDYFPGELVNVDFYRNLPRNDYEIILLRVHSAAFNPEHEVFDLFTSEPYSNKKYVSDQRKERLRKAAFAPYDLGDPVYFGITSKFVSSSMKGGFDHALVIMMGCDGLKYDKMAEAFINKGAEVYIGWSGLVTANHTDQATLDLLQRLLTEVQPVEDALTGTMNAFGIDPAYGSELSYYPASGGNITIPDNLNR